MGLIEDGTSSKYTPGDKYSAILIAPLMKSLCPAGPTARTTHKNLHRRRGLRTLKSIFMMSPRLFVFSGVPAALGSGSTLGFGLTTGVASGFGASGFRCASAFGGTSGFD